METKYTSAKNKNGKQNLPVISYGKSISRFASNVQCITTVKLRQIIKTNSVRLVFLGNLAIFSRLFSRKFLENPIKFLKISGPFGQALFDGHNTSLFVSSFLAKYNPNSKLQVEVEVQVEPGKYI